MKRSLLTIVTLLLCIASYASNYSTEFRQIDTLISQKMSRDAISLARDVYHRAASDGDKISQLRALQKGVTTELYIDYSEKDQLLDSLINMKREFRGDEVSCALLNTIAFDLTIFSWRDEVSRELRASIIKESMAQKELLTTIAAEPYTPFFYLWKDSGIASTTLYIALLRKYVDAPRYLYSSQKIVKSLYEELISLPEMNDELQVVVQYGYIKFMVEDEVERLKELEQRYSHCDAVVMVSAYLIEREIMRERFKDNEELSYERFDKMCKEVKRKHPNSKHIKDIDNIIFDLHRPSGEIKLPKQLYPNTEREVSVNSRNVDQITFELYRLSGEIAESETIPGIESYNKNRRQNVDSLANLSELVNTHKLTLKPRLKQETKSLIPLKIKEYGRYLVVVRDADGGVLTGEVTSVSKIGATTYLTNDKLIANVVDFDTGAPIKKASFDLYIGDEYQFTRKLASEDGRYDIADRDDLKGNTHYKIEVDDGAGDILSVSNQNYNSSQRSTNDRYAITCYTDRGTYRPGDTVRIHSVVYSPSKELHEGLHICNRVDFPSGDILTYDHTETDAWGGATSLLVIPKDVQSGQYRVYAFSNSKKANHAQKYIRIESYTQPTSQITLESAKQIFFPKDSVVLQGRVTGYDGRCIEGVDVHYEVKQRVSYGYDGYETTAQNSVKTDRSGEYRIEFVASAAEYLINARMVDKNGETREVKRNLYIDESPYYIEPSTPCKVARSLQQPFKFHRNIKSGEPLVCSYTIHKDGDDKTLFSGEFRDDEPLEIPYDKLSDGAYWIKWSAPRADDGSRRFLIYTDTESKTPVGDDILFVDAPQKEVAAGSPLRYIVSTTEQEIYALVTLSSGDKLLHSEVQRIPRGTHEFSIDNATTISQDLLLNVSTVKGGVRYNENQTYNIVKRGEKIEVKIEELPKELRASTSNELRVKVQECDSKQAVRAKLIVTIYDKASDQINPNTLYPLKSKANSYGYINRSVEPYSYRSLRFDFSTGKESIMIRGLSDSADFEEDQPSLSVGYGASKSKDITGGLAGAKVRNDFSQTALFSGEIITDESGEAVIPFTLSNLLTTYNVKVVAVTSDARSATAESEFISTKKVMASTLLPQLIRVGDLLKFKTLAINRLNYPVEATIKMEQFDTRTRSLYNNGLRKVTLAPNSSKSIEWEITAPDYVDELGVKISLESDSGNDIEQHTIEVDPAVERVKLGRINYFDSAVPYTYIKPKELLQAGAFNESMTMSYEAIIPAIIRSVVAERGCEPTTAIDFANRLYRAQATHTLAMRYQTSTLERSRDNERANIPNREWWFDHLIEMRDHTKAHKEVYLSHYRLEEFRCSDGGFSWLRGGESSLMVSLYVARMQLGEMAIKCKGSRDRAKELERTMNYLDKEIGRDSTINRSLLEYLELRSRKIVNNEPPTPAWSSYLDLIEREWRGLNTYQMAQVALVLRRSGRDNSEIINVIKQQAVERPNAGVTFPSGYADNFATIVEGNIAAHTLIMTLLKSTHEDDELVRKMVKWLMLQRKNQVWVNSATTLEVVSKMYDIVSSDLFKDQNKLYVSYPQDMVKFSVLTSKHLDIDIVREGKPITAKALTVNNKSRHPVFLTLDYSYDVSLKDVTANSSGFSVTRELLTSYYPKIGDIVKVRYTIRSDQNINLVKLRTMKCGAYEPRELRSGYQNGYYREVRGGEINYYFDLIERGTTTIEEEFMVWYSGEFTDGYAVVESILNPHLSGNTAVERIEVE